MWRFVLKCENKAKNDQSNAQRLMEDMMDVMLYTHSAVYLGISLSLRGLYFQVKGHEQKDVHVSMRLCLSVGACR